MVLKVFIWILYCSTHIFFLVNVIFHVKSRKITVQPCRFLIVNVFTVRPASLLCRFIAERASGRFSLASANSLDTSTPNSASSLQPPHFQPSPGGPLWWESHPHMVDVPSAHERVTANATPAEAIAWTNADSLVAERDGRRQTERQRKGEGKEVCQSYGKRRQGDLYYCQHPDRCIERDTFRR